MEFFIEGGRSRTGRVLEPKLGILGMCVDPVLDGTLSDVSFVPISIGYEQIVEAGSYAREQKGRRKRRRRMSERFSKRARCCGRSTDACTWTSTSRFSLRAFAAARGLSIHRTSENEPDAQRRTLVGQLGHRIVIGINRVTRVTPHRGGGGGASVLRHGEASGRKIFTVGVKG